jgi:hypothetical protein
MWRLTLLKIQRAQAVARSSGQGQPRISIHRKGNSLNYTIHVNKESRATYDTDLTMFSYKRRVFFSPSMEFVEIQSIESARLKLWIETMDKGATFYVSSSYPSNGFVLRMFLEKS